MIHYDMPFDEYRRLPALNISALKHIKRSPLHYRHALTSARETDALRLGSAAHMAVLEPERFVSAHAVWDARTAAGAMSPRRGKAWDDFVTASVGREIITADEHAGAVAIAEAVRADETAMQYLREGCAEVTITADVAGRTRKGRVDWLITRDDQHCIIGLKTTRDCRPFVFGKQAATLGYHWQWAWYHDLYMAETGIEPILKEIVVESAPPYAVAVYHITEDIIAQGREDYTAALETLEECERTGRWPGPVDGEEDLTMPSWAYTQSPDDLSELGLEDDRE